MSAKGNDGTIAGAVMIDKSNPELAAVGVSEVLSKVIIGVGSHLSDEDRIVFLATLSARAVGGLAALVGADATITMLECNLASMREAAPHLKFLASTARRGVH